MNIYSITVNPNRYQWIMPRVDDSLILDYTIFDGKPKLNVFSEIEWYCYNPLKEIGNFYTLGTGGTFAFNEEVYRSDLFSMLEMSGEILPIEVEGENLYVINVLEVCNILNKRDSVFQTYANGERGRILEYSFHRIGLPESSLFKIPETCKGEILTYTGIKDRNDEFKSLYEKLGFTGLDFELIYSC